MVQIIPADQATENAAYELVYTDGELTSIVKTLDGATYTKTLTYTDGVLTDVSEWVQS